MLILGEIGLRWLNETNHFLYNFRYLDGLIAKIMQSLIFNALKLSSFFYGMVCTQSFCPCRGRMHLGMAHFGKPLSLSLSFLGFCISPFLYFVSSPECYLNDVSGLYEQLVKPLFLTNLVLRSLLILEKSGDFILGLTNL
jgi:hypothetical protein